MLNEGIYRYRTELHTKDKDAKSMSYLMCANYSDGRPARPNIYMDLNILLTIKIIKITSLVKKNLK